MSLDNIKCKRKLNAAKKLNGCLNRFRLKLTYSNIAIVYSYKSLLETKHPRNKGFDRSFVPNMRRTVRFARAFELGRFRLFLSMLFLSKFFKLLSQNQVWLTRCSRSRKVKRCSSWSLHKVLLISEIDFFLHVCNFEYLTELL